MPSCSSKKPMKAKKYNVGGAVPAMKSQAQLGADIKAQVQRNSSADANPAKAGTYGGVGGGQMMAPAMRGAAQARTPTAAKSPVKGMQYAKGGAVKAPPKKVKKYSDGGAVGNSAQRAFGSNMMTRSLREREEAAGLAEPVYSKYKEPVASKASTPAKAAKPKTEAEKRRQAKFDAEGVKKRKALDDMKF